MTHKTISTLIKVSTFALFFVGCESTSKTTGTSAKAPTISKQYSDNSTEDSTESTSEGSGKKIKKKSVTNNVSDQVTGNIASSTEPLKQNIPNLPKSNLNWDGTSLIGTPQLFLIPIE